MAELLRLSESEEKNERYKELLPQLKSLLEAETDLVANLANTSAVLKQALGFFWVGFYLVKDRELVLGPFQGELACTRIGYGKGVCGTAWLKGTTQIVENVDLFPGHIACSSRSKSEIVVPIQVQSRIVAVLDVDSTALSDFDQVDAHYLEEVASLISSIWPISNLALT
jgi:GAF domain-containing protein